MCPWDWKYINPASVDVTIGPTLLEEVASAALLLNVSVGYQGNFADATPNNPYKLRPGNFILAHTAEGYLEFPCGQKHSIN